MLYIIATCSLEGILYHIIRSICTIRCMWHYDPHCALKQIPQRHCIPTSIARLCSWYQLSCGASSFLSADAGLLGECCQSIALMRLLIRPRWECMGCDHCVRRPLLSLLEVMIDRHASRSMWKSDSLSFQIVFWSVSNVGIFPSLLHTLSDFDCIRHPTLELLSILNFYLLPLDYLIRIFLLSGDLYVSTLWSDTVCIYLRRQRHCATGVVIIVVIIIHCRLRRHG